MVDEACALIKTELDSLPTELDETQRKIMQLQIEEAALKKETDNLSKGRLTELQKELSELQEDFSVKKARWDNEKAAVDKIHQLKTETYYYCNVCLNNLGLLSFISACGIVPVVIINFFVPALTKRFGRRNCSDYFPLDRNPGC